MSCIVYFIRPAGYVGPIKIGISDRPHDRLCSLMTWSPYPLEIAATIPGDWELERRIHSMFVSDHSHREWFRPSQRLVEFVAAIAGGARIENLVDFNSPLVSLRKKANRVFTPDRRLYLSYSSRLRCAYSKINYHAPEDVSEIIGRWAGYGRSTPITPTPEQIARIEEVLSDPVKHGRKSSPRGESEAA